MSKEELKKYLGNENVQYFLYQIFKSESDKDSGVINLGGFNQSGPNPKKNYYSSSAFGSQQFTGETRNDVLKGYGIDAWSQDVNEQQMATLALLSMDDTLKDVLKGDYKSTIEKKRWEAFTKRPTLLTGNKPDNWKTKYSNLKDNAVYDPKKSWDKIPDKNKIGKIKLFNSSKYSSIIKELGLSDTINSNIGANQLKQISNLTSEETYESNINLGLSKEEQTASNIVGDAKKLVEIHDATVNARTDVEDIVDFRSTVDGVSKSFANDLKDGRFKGDDDEARSEYFKRISKAFGWSDVNQLDPKQLGVARGQVEEFFQYTKGQGYGEKIGGDQAWDSLFEDMTEDKYYRTLELSKEVRIPPTGRAPKEVYAELSGNPITMSMIEGSYNTESGYDGRKLIYDESSYDSYLASKAPRLRKQISSGENTIEDVVNYLSENQSETFIVPDSEENAISQSIVDSELFPESTPLLDYADKPKDLETEEGKKARKEKESKLLGEYGAYYDKDGNIVSEDYITKEDKDLSFDQYKKKYPEATQEEYNNRNIKKETIDDIDSSDDYFDLRGEGDLSKESFLDKIGGLSSLIGLASGAVGLGSALKDVDIPKDPKLGPAFQQRLEESKRLAQQGLTPSELAKAHNDLDSSYATGIENIVRGSAGNRAQFLAGLGGLDVARQSALMDIAVADAQMQRDNQQKYDSMMMVNEQYEAARQAKYQNAQYQQDSANKSAGAALAGAGLSMVSDAIGSRQVNRYNKLKTEKLLLDMGYKAGKDGKSAQDQVGADNEGVKMKTKWELDSNPLNSEDQAVSSVVNQGLLGNTTSGLLDRKDNEVDLGQQMYDIFNTGK